MSRRPILVVFFSFRLLASHLQVRALKLDSLLSFSVLLIFVAPFFTLGFYFSPL